MPVTPYEYARTRRSIFDALLDARTRFGGKKEILEDADRTPLTFDRLVLGAMVMGRKLEAITAPGEAVGVLIANSVGGMVSLFGLAAFGRTPAMLNFTAGAQNIKAACQIAQVRTILTARRFVELGNLQPLIEALQTDYRIVYLEDLRDSVTTLEKVRGVAEAALPHLAKAKVDPDSPGVILFTSGTEGAPKGVVLSHANIVANVCQIAGHVDLNPEDIVFNPLPIFHCFGLTGGVLLPVLTGMKCVLFPSPLQAKTIVKLIRDTRSTILFATDTFAYQYARTADEGDLNSLRFIVAGAEKVKDETRSLMMQRFGVTIIEGYGATETSPVIAVNTPDERNRPGTVGRLLPGIEWKLESIPGITGGGRLYVRGPNVMSGYLRLDNPGVVEPLPGGWHDTGDVVALDAEGYCTIKGRVKRFAKIGGEMVSLLAVEQHAARVWPDHAHVAIAVSDARKGEQIVLLTERPDPDRNDLLLFAKTSGISELSIPRRVMHIDAVPLLGTGKTDYVAAQRIADAQITQVAA